jgi:hypothetical protein
MDYAEIPVVEEIIEDLTVELEATDDQFSATLLSQKVVNAYKDVMRTRRYPSHYTDEEKMADMERFSATVRNIALYDYNQIGLEFQSRNSENDVARTFVKRDSLFGGVIPLSSL